MAGNTFGRFIQLTSFGESHGSMIGGVIDGYPSGYTINNDLIQEALDKRSPGNNPFGTTRRETDSIEIVSGIFDSKSTGAPIAFFIRNASQNPSDYDHLKNVYRPSHAAFTYEKKYGNYDYRGGGRSSARETAVRVAAGAFCNQLLAFHRITVKGYVSQIGKIKVPFDYKQLDLNKTDVSPLKCPDKETEREMMSYLDEVRKEGDSAGGIVTCIISGVPAGLGNPVFDRFQAILGMAMLSINAVKGFEYGEGFAASSMRGSDHNDVYSNQSGNILPSTNHAGGILGGITTGQDVWFRVAFKPVSSISKSQSTVDKQGNPIDLEIGGRHDICIVPRAVPVVEAMASLVIADFMIGAGIIHNNI